MSNVDQRAVELIVEQLDEARARVMEAEATAQRLSKAAAKGAILTAQLVNKVNELTMVASCCEVLEGEKRALRAELHAAKEKHAKDFHAAAADRLAVLAEVAAFLRGLGDQAKTASMPGYSIQEAAKARDGVVELFESLAKKIEVDDMKSATR